jgi:plastocyanin
VRGNLRAALAASTLLALTLTGCGGAPQVTPAGTPAVTIQLSAYNSKFEQTSLSVLANAPFAIEFNNKDALPHNVSIVSGPPGSTGEIFSGPGERLYVFPALAIGTYTFHCEVHPDMTGTIQAT